MFALVSSKAIIIVFGFMMKFLFYVNMETQTNLTKGQI